jgi:hypothetical protein
MININAVYLKSSAKLHYYNDFEKKKLIFFI